MPRVSPHEVVIYKASLLHVDTEIDWFSGAPEPFVREKNYRKENNGRPQRDKTTHLGL